MNNNPSSNFSTVFFLVVLFIGMGVLIYHACEITLENGQLKETVNTLQTSEATLNTENATLKTENTTLKTENATLKTENATLKNENVTIIDENSRLKAELIKEVSKNIFLNTSDADKIAELEKLRNENNNLRAENLQIKIVGNKGDGSHLENIEVLQSAVLPIAALLLISYNTYVLLNNIRRKKAASLLGMCNSTGKNQTPRIIESQFAENKH